MEITGIITGIQASFPATTLCNRKESREIVDWVVVDLEKIELNLATIAELFI